MEINGYAHYVDKESFLHNKTNKLLLYKHKLESNMVKVSIKSDLVYITDRITFWVIEKR